jgi:hypothetical protein
LTSVAVTALPISELSFATMSAGNPAGPNTPYQDVTSNPGNPASLAVGNNTHLGTAFMLSGRSL